MTITYHRDLIQGTKEWLDTRRGLLTASELRHILTPTFKPALNEKVRAHIYNLAAQRVSGFVDDSAEVDDMLRGREDEIDGYDLYREKYAWVEPVGFITNDRWGFTLGYSPDGLVGDDGLIEIKSRKQRFQVETVAKNAIPPEHVIQVQAGLLISEREWCDFISYSAGLPMFVTRAHAVPEIQDAIVEAAIAAEKQIAEVVDAYEASIELGGFHPTPRRLEREILL